MSKSWKKWKTWQMAKLLLRHFSWQFYLHSKFLPVICWERDTSQNYFLTFPFVRDVWAEVNTTPSSLISHALNLLILKYFSRCQRRGLNSMLSFFHNFLNIIRWFLIRILKFCEKCVLMEGKYVIISSLQKILFSKSIFNIANVDD